MSRNTLWLWAALTIWVIGLGVAPRQSVAELVDRIVAIVNDDIILQSELDQAMAPAKERLKQQGYTLSQQKRVLADNRSRMLEQMIYEKLSDQQLKKYRINLRDEEIDNTIERIKKVNKLSDEGLRRKLALDGLSYDAYRQKVKEQLLRTKLVNLEVKSRIVITDEDIRAYYEANPQRYLDKIKYHLRHILIKVPPDAAQLERQRVFQQAQAIHERIQTGESFEKLAGVYSDAATASRGGNLGVFEASMLTEQVRKAIQGLKAGQHSPLVETEQGYQIFYIENVISTGGKSLEEAKTEIQDKLYAEEVDKKYQTWLKEMRQSAHVQIMD